MPPRRQFIKADFPLSHDGDKRYFVDKQDTEEKRHYLLQGEEVAWLADGDAWKVIRTNALSRTRSKKSLARRKSQADQAQADPRKRLRTVAPKQTPQHAVLPTFASTQLPIESRSNGLDCSAADAASQILKVTLRGRAYLSAHISKKPISPPASDSIEELDLPKIPAMSAQQLPEHHRDLFAEELATKCVQTPSAFWSAKTQEIDHVCVTPEGQLALPSFSGPANYSPVMDYVGQQTAEKALPPLYEKDFTRPEMYSQDSDSTAGFLQGHTDLSATTSNTASVDGWPATSSTTEETLCLGPDLSESQKYAGQTKLAQQSSVTDAISGSSSTFLSHTRETDQATCPVSLPHSDQPICPKTQSTSLLDPTQLLPESYKQPQSDCASSMTNGQPSLHHLTSAATPMYSPFGQIDMPELYHPHIIQPQFFWLARHIGYTSAVFPKLALAIEPTAQEQLAELQGHNRRLISQWLALPLQERQRRLQLAKDYLPHQMSKADDAILECFSNHPPETQDRDGKTNPTTSPFRIYHEPNANTNDALEQHEEIVIGKQPTLHRINKREDRSPLSCLNQSFVITSAQATSAIPVTMPSRKDLVETQEEQSDEESIRTQASPPPFDDSPSEDEAPDVEKAELSDDKGNGIVMKANTPGSVESSITPEAPASQVLQSSPLLLNTDPNGSWISIKADVDTIERGKSWRKRLVTEEDLWLNATMVSMGIADAVYRLKQVNQNQFPNAIIKESLFWESNSNCNTRYVKLGTELTGQQDTIAIFHLARDYHHVLLIWRKRRENRTLYILDSQVKNSTLKQGQDLLRRMELQDVPCKVVKVPQQANGHDCGVYAMHFAEMLLRFGDSALDQFDNDTELDRMWTPSAEIWRKRVIALINAHQDVGFCSPYQSDEIAMVNEDTNPSNVKAQPTRSGKGVLNRPSPFVTDVFSSGNSQSRRQSNNTESPDEGMSPAYPNVVSERFARTANESDMQINPHVTPTRPSEKALGKQRDRTIDDTPPVEAYYDACLSFEERPDSFEWPEGEDLLAEVQDEPSNSDRIPHSAESQAEEIDLSSVSDSLEELYTDLNSWQKYTTSEVHQQISRAISLLDRFEPQMSASLDWVRNFNGGTTTSKAHLWMMELVIRFRDLCTAEAAFQHPSTHRITSYFATSCYKLFRELLVVLSDTAGAPTATLAACSILNVFILSVTSRPHVTLEMAQRFNPAERGRANLGAPVEIPRPTPPISHIHTILDHVIDRVTHAWSRIPQAPERIDAAARRRRPRPSAIENGANNPTSLSSPTLAVPAYLPSAPSMKPVTPAEDAESLERAMLKIDENFEEDSCTALVEAEALANSIQSTLLDPNIEGEALLGGFRKVQTLMVKLARSAQGSRDQILNNRRTSLTTILSAQPRILNTLACVVAGLPLGPQKGQVTELWQGLKREPLLILAARSHQPRESQQAPPRALQNHTRNNSLAIPEPHQPSRPRQALHAPIVNIEGFYASEGSAPDA